MYFKYIKTILFGLLITTIIINYLQINILNIRENMKDNSNTEGQEVPYPLQKDKKLFKLALDAEESRSASEN